MRKRILLGFLLISVCLNNAFGQEFTKNTIYGGISTTPYGFFAFLFASPLYVMGFDIGYEYSFNNRFSASVEVGMDPFFRLYADIRGRWYPWSKSFFLGLGIGVIWDIGEITPPGEFVILSISPKLGWKIKIGKQKNFILMPYMTARILLYDDYASFLTFDTWKGGFNIGYTF
jgi:hypothetical protein